MHGLLLSSVRRVSRTFVPTQTTPVLQVGSTSVPPPPRDTFPLPISPNSSFPIIYYNGGGGERDR